MTYVRLILYMAMAAFLGYIIWTVNGWKNDAEGKQAAEARAAAVGEILVRERVARGLAERRVGEAEAEVAAVAAEKQKVRVIFREATREDPDCAAWAAGDVLCPLGVREDAPEAGTDGMSRHPRQPDTRLQSLSRRSTTPEQERGAGRGVDRLPPVRGGVPREDGGHPRSG